LKGEETDRIPVSFYELNGFDQNPFDTDAYNVYSDPSWRPVLDLAAEQTERFIMRGMAFKGTCFHFWPNMKCETKIEANGDRHCFYSCKLGNKCYTSHTVQTRDVNTIWTLEHPLKDADDLAHWLKYADDYAGDPQADTSSILQTETELGDSGIVEIELGSPLCDLAAQFSMENYLVIAMEERGLFNEALEKIARRRLREVESFSQAAPGRLWRIYGPEYACSPYLPPALFEEYSAKYDAPIADVVRQSGGFPRVHCHGNLKAVLPLIRKTGWTAIDPVEPPPQGDVFLNEAREGLGEDFTIFGNIEVSFIELLDEKDFTECVRRAIKEGPNKKGRRFVLMPSSSPYGCIISDRVRNNYRIMIEECCGRTN
jgi:hypothetical protein